MQGSHPVPAAGTEPGQRQLNGPQTTGRSYADLSEPIHRMTRDDDVAVPMRDGAKLLADVHRPDDTGRFPALVSASPYPRQIQDLGAPMGFIEAGASDCFVPRGYVHVIANLRGTGGSDGQFGLFDRQERDDMFDLVEWAAAQPWCDGNVGMVGISYFAMTQLEAAVGRPPHLKAIFPVAVTSDIFEATHHHGLFNASFISPFLTMVGIASGHGDALWRGRLVDVARRVLAQPRIHDGLPPRTGRDEQPQHHPLLVSAPAQHALKRPGGLWTVECGVWSPITDHTPRLRNPGRAPPRAQLLLSAMFFAN